MLLMEEVVFRNRIIIREIILDIRVNKILINNKEAVDPNFREEILNKIYRFINKIKINFTFINMVNKDNKSKDIQSNYNNK